MTPDPTAQSREKILFHLKTQGPLAAAALARRLGVTPMAVRQHLYLLREEGMVEFEDERRPVGRPARIWRLAAAAASRFPDTHAGLTVEILEAVRTAFGAQGLDRLISARTKQQIRRYRERLPALEAPLEQRVRALASIRREEGYMADWSRERDGSFLVVENHCPICAAASVCQGLCRDELALFRAVLGKDASVERTDHILSGARRCAYRVVPRE